VEVDDVSVEVRVGGHSGLVAAVVGNLQELQGAVRHRLPQEFEDERLDLTKDFAAVVVVIHEVSNDGGLSYLQVVDQLDRVRPLCL
jgi:hypothetical protein